MLGPFTILAEIGHAYRLELPSTTKIHHEFAPNLLRLDPEDPLEGQRNESPGPIVVEDEDEWRWRTYWTPGTTDEANGFSTVPIGRDTMSTCIDKFESCQDVVNDFQERYPNKPR